MALDAKLDVPQGNSKLEHVRYDTLPEWMIGRGHMRDQGCDLAASCLSCPFVMCRHDVNFKSVKKRRRNMEIAEMKLSGLSAPFIAHHFGIGTRTVYKVVRTEATK